LKNDGSCSFRLHTIGNKVKHLSPEEYGPADTVPLWLSNAGLHSFGVAVTYAEAGDDLRQLAEMTEQIQNPRAFMESFAAVKGQAASSAEPLGTIEPVKPPSRTPEDNPPSE
jgi:hypothetical protein